MATAERQKLIMNRLSAAYKRQVGGSKDTGVRQGVMFPGNRTFILTASRTVGMEVTNRLKSTQSGVTTHVELSDLEA